MYIRLTIAETIMRARILKWGNCLAVRIPNSVAEAAGLREGDAIEIEVAEEGSVQLLRVGSVPSLSQLVSQITAGNRYAEVSVGGEVEREALEW
jgi:antitoxin MazE